MGITVGGRVVVVVVVYKTSLGTRKCKYSRWRVGESEVGPRVFLGVHTGSHIPMIWQDEEEY